MTREPSLRTGNPHSAVSVARVLVSCGWFVCLGLGTYWSVRLAWADHLSRAGDLGSRLRAVRLFPSATLYNRLAEKREELGGNAISDLEQAVALEPENAAPRLHLGSTAELAGDFGLAERSLLAAAALSRQYQPRYQLAQYYFRRQDADRFERWSRAAFGAAYGDVTPLLNLCWSLRPDAEWLAQQAPAGRIGIAGQFLLYAAQHHQAEGARALALRMAATARPAGLPVLLEYCDACLYQGNGATATDVWNALCARRLLPDRPLDPHRGVSLTNAGFEHPPTGKGLDWRIEQASWLRVEYSGGGELRVIFSGSQPENCLVASQYVPVVPGNRYRLALVWPPAGTATTDALGWIVSTLSGSVVPAERNADRSLTFTAPTGVVRLGLFYRRPPGATRLDGTIAIAGARLDLVR